MTVALDLTVTACSFFPFAISDVTLRLIAERVLSVCNAPGAPNLLTRPTYSIQPTY